jgi:hypothetical protein
MTPYRKAPMKTIKTFFNATLYVYSLLIIGCASIQAYIDIKEALTNHKAKKLEKRLKSA